MDYNTNTNDWATGEIVTLPRTKRLLKKSGDVSYEHIIESRYMCIREAGNGKRGILVKVLGKAYGDYAEIVKGQPFWKDDSDNLFYGALYYGYPLPSAEDVKEVLGIVRGNERLLNQFEDAGMHINPNSTFWVNDIKRNVCFKRKLQYLNGSDGQIYPASNDSIHYRISIVFFQDGEISW